MRTRLQGHYVKTIVARTWRANALSRLGVDFGGMPCPTYALIYRSG